MIRTLPLAAFSLAAMAGTALAAPEIVASTKPIHSLVASVTAGVTEPYLVVKGAASPHTYSLRPSDAAALEGADLVFWTGPGFELFLADALETLAGNAEVVDFSEAEGLTLLPLREGGAFEAHSHEDETEAEHAAHSHEGHGHDHHEHDHHDHHDHDEEGHDHHAHEGEADLHFWLDPQNAILMVNQIEATLSSADPENAAAYAANAEATRQSLDALTAELTETLALLADKPFVVFHDAYQYFENRFGITLAGTITVSPDVTPGAARIDELRTKIAELDATCVFAEPNFAPSVVNTIIEGTSAKAGTLDPEGSALTEGPNLYPDLLRSLAAGIIDCLG